MIMTFRCKDCKHDTGRCVGSTRKGSHKYCFDPKVMTNGDRIRAMSDEGLAKAFTATVANGCPPQMDWDCAKDKNGWDACDACWCKWLKQPVEEVKG